MSIFEVDGRKNKVRVVSFIPGYMADGSVADLLSKSLSAIQDVP